MEKKDLQQAKEKLGQKEAILSVSDLAKKIGVTPKRMRSILRSEYPRDIKGKKWEITATLAKKIEKDSKAKTKVEGKAGVVTEVDNKLQSNNLLPSEHYVAEEGKI
jgi:hypothetical protein